MVIIKEDYVSFELAKLLKDKEFNELCRAAYTNYGKLFTTQVQQYITNVLCSKGYLWDCAAPTLQMSCKWLRKVHNLFIQVEFDPPTFSADIYKMDEIDEYSSAKHIPPTFANAKSYEEVVEAALKYSLENLI